MVDRYPGTTKIGFIPSGNHYGIIISVFLISFFLKIPSVHVSIACFVIFHLNSTVIEMLKLSYDNMILSWPYTSYLGIIWRNISIIIICYIRSLMQQGLSVPRATYKGIHK